MRIHITSVLVEDQDKAAAFYTSILGFVINKDIPLGEFKWLTLVSPEGTQDVELLLEPNQNPAAKTLQKALYSQGIPLTSFAVDDIHKEYERLKSQGVTFRSEPVQAGPVWIAMFEDTCGNLIQIVQSPAK